jgi:hypothetical protein
MFFLVIRRKFRASVNKNMSWLKLKYTDVKKLATPNSSSISSPPKPATIVEEETSDANGSSDEPKKDQ